MARLDSIKKLRQVEWGRTYLWDLHFTDPSPPAPFADWFPAVSVEEEVAKVEGGEIEGAFLSSIKFPLRTSARKITIEFLDDVNLTLFTWLRSWINDTILNDQKYIATLEEACRLLQISRLGLDGQPIETKSYWVYPEMDLTFSGNSDSESPKYSADFIVAGRVDEGNSSTGTTGDETEEE